MKLIHKRVDSIVYYDELHDLYVKQYTAYPWYSKKGIRMLLGIMRTPGQHALHMHKVLKSNGIACADIVDASDYQVVTKAIDAIGLNAYRDAHGRELLRAELLDLLARLLKIGIVHRDCHENNFLYDGEKLYIIDLEALDDSPLRFLPKQKLLYYMWRGLLRDDAFCKEIMAIWPERSIPRKIMDAIYTARSFFLRLLGKGNKEEQDFIKRMGL